MLCKSQLYLENKTLWIHHWMETQKKKPQTKIKRHVDAESAEENVEQDDAMEKSNDVNSDENSYVSHYPDTRRYSMANAMATNRPQYRTDNQGYSVDLGGSIGDDDDKKIATKIDMPSSQPPQYSTIAAEKTMSDKKVKVRLQILTSLFNQ